MKPFCVVCGTDATQGCWRQHSLAVTTEPDPVAGPGNAEVLVTVTGEDIRQAKRYLVSPVCLALRRVALEGVTIEAGIDWLLVRRSGILVGKTATPRRIKKELFYWEVAGRDMRPFGTRVVLPDWAILLPVTAGG